MSHSEFTFSIKPADMAEIQEEKNKEDKKLKQLLHKPEELLASILIGNNIVVYWPW